MIDVTARAQTELLRILKQHPDRGVRVFVSGFG